MLPVWGAGRADVGSELGAPSPLLDPGWGITVPLDLFCVWCGPNGTRMPFVGKGAAGAQGLDAQGTEATAASPSPWVRLSSTCDIAVSVSSEVGSTWAEQASCRAPGCPSQR